MNVKSDWEVEAEESRKNLWLVVTKNNQLLCTKFKGMFFIKNGDMAQVNKDLIVSTEKL